MFPRVTGSVVSIPARHTDCRTLQFLSRSVRRAELKGLSLRPSDSEDRLSELACKEAPARPANLIRKLGL
jgi:hypothetical protein